MQSNQLVNFANEFDFLPDLARVAAAAVLWRQPGPPAARAEALGAAGAAGAPFPSPLPSPAVPGPRFGAGAQPRAGPAAGAVLPAPAGRCHTRPGFGSSRPLGRAGVPRGRAPLRAKPAEPR